MPKLHELLAVEGSLKSQAIKTTADLSNTFDKKSHHFGSQLTTFKPFAEGEPTTQESRLDLQTTIPKELDWLSSFLVKAIDASYQVAEANTKARADVVLEDGTVLAEGLPATALLELEKRIRELSDFIIKIPTLDPAKGFEADDSRGEGVFRARDIEKTRTKKVQKALVLAPATDKHAAQVQLIVEDEPIGKILIQEWSGLITVARKGDLIARTEDLVRAVKAARSRANEADVETVKTRIGKKILTFIFG